MVVSTNERAGKNGFHSLNLFDRKSWKSITPLFKEVDVLFLDPPREGFPQLPDIVSEMPSLQVIYYVSCNSSTFFRDIKPLVGDRWELSRLQAFDLFPQTPHLEIMSKFIAK